MLPWPEGIPEPRSHPPLTTAPSDGPKVARWIEANCVYGEGDKHGRPVRLEPFQKIILIWVFERLWEGGPYRYRRVLLEFPKGQGKTPLSAWIVAYLLAHQTSPVIPVGAASYEQAELLFGDLRTSVGSPRLAPHFEAFEGEVQLRSGAGRAYKVAAIAGTNDGQRPSAFAADEIHEWTGNKARVHLVISNGCAKRAGSIVINTTTPGSDIDSMAGQMHSYGIRVNSGEIVDHEFLFVWWGSDPSEYDLDDPVQLEAAVRACSPAADAFMSVSDTVARYYQIPLHEYARYHLGWWTTIADSWLPPGTIGDLIESAAIPDGTEVVLGFDGSYNGDSTALVAVTVRQDRPHIVVVDAWERPESFRGSWSVPIEDVEDAIRAAFRRWQVLELCCDPYRWARTYQVLEAEGLPVVEFPQSPARMTPATQRFYEAAVGGLLTIDDDPRLVRHLSNATWKVDARGSRLAKEHRNSTRRIDLAVAAVMALDRAAWHHNDQSDYNVLDSIL